MSGDAISAPRRSICESRGQELALWTWTPSGQPRGLVVIFHGLGAHARFPTVRVAAEALVSKQWIVAAIDFAGHGDSPGLRGYIESADALVADAVTATQQAAAENHELPLFLLGSSMGGAIALMVGQQVHVSGTVLLAPMLAPPAPTWQWLLLRVLSYSPLARIALIPSSATDNKKQYADATILKQIEDDTLAYKGKLRVASAESVLDLARRTEFILPTVSHPFIILSAERDLVLGAPSIDAAKRLREEAATPREMRAQRTYDALHGLLCSPEPLRSKIVTDILDWMYSQARREIL
jgi:acylglycerol lipase